MSKSLWPDGIVFHTLLTSFEFEETRPDAVA